MSLRDSRGTLDPSAEKLADRLARHLWLAPPLILAALVAPIGSASAPGQAARAIAILGCLLAVAWRLAGWLLPTASRTSRAVASGVLATALVTIPALALGHFGLLRAETSLAALAALAVLVALLHLPFGAARSLPEPAVARSADRWADAAGVVLLGFLALMMVNDVWRRLDKAPCMVAFDDCYYHLPAAALMQRTHDLQTYKFAFGDTSTSFYPMVGEIVSWFLLQPFSGSDVAARWTALPFALGCLIGVAAVARRLGVGRLGAVLAVALFAAIPRFWPDLALIAGNDAAAAFFCLAAVDSALALAEGAALGRTAIFGVALGLLAGTKYVGLPTAGSVLVLAGLATWLGRGQLGLGARGAARPWTERCVNAPVALAVVLGLALVVGGYTYLRNWVAVGNPVFPQQVTFFGHPIFLGWPEASLAARMQGGEAAISPFAFLWRRGDLFGPWTRWTLLPAALLAPLLALWPQRSWTSGTRLLRVAVLALPALLFLEFLVFTHDHRDLRYFLAGLALAAVACAWCLDQLPATFGHTAQALLTVLVLGELALRQETWSRAVLELALGCSAALGLAWLTGRRAAVRRWGVAAASLAAATVAVAGADRPLSRYAAARAAAAPFASATALERLAGPQPKAIAYVGYNQPYAFFGSRLRDRVEIVSAHGTAYDRTFTWGGTGRIPSANGDLRTWTRNLIRLSIEYVVLDPRGEPEPERTWLSAHPDRFEHLATVDEIELWRIR